MTLRGQGIFVEIIFVLVIVLMIISLAPTLQTQVVEQTSNDTLFPTNSPQYLLAGLYTFVWLALGIVAMLMVFSRRNEGG